MPLLFAWSVPNRCGYAGRHTNGDQDPGCDGHAHAHRYRRADGYRGPDPDVLSHRHADNHPNSGAHGFRHGDGDDDVPADRQRA